MIPSFIEKEHLLKAIQQVSCEGVHPNGAPTITALCMIPTTIHPNTL